MLLSDVITLKIIAKDGYTEDFDLLKIYIYNFSLLYIGFTLAQYLGPIIACLGIWEYKYKFYAYFFKSKYKYSKDIAFVGENYTKLIPIIDV
jgi:hypothetical protein